MSLKLAANKYTVLDRTILTLVLPRYMKSQMILTIDHGTQYNDIQSLNQLYYHSTAIGKLH